MSCPTCDHTMHNLGLDQAGRRTFWCPRCGTIKTETEAKPGVLGWEEHQMPYWTKRMTCSEWLTLRAEVFALRAAQLKQAAEQLDEKP